MTMVHLLGEMTENDKLGILAPSKLRSSSFDPLPYFFVGDETFPLKTWLMRRLIGKLDDNQRIFNYRLSCVSLAIENTFGILAVRWRCLAPHNYLRLTDNATNFLFGFVDSFDSSGKLKQGEWRALNVDNRGLLPISRVKASRYREDAHAQQIRSLNM